MLPDGCDISNVELLSSENLAATFVCPITVDAPTTVKAATGPLVPIPNKPVAVKRIFSTPSIAHTIGELAL